MADDKTTKTPEQPVTDSGPGKETPPAPPKEPEKVSVSPEPEKKTEPEVKNPQVSVYNFAEIMKEKKAEERAAAPGGEKPDPAKAEKPEKQPEAPKKAEEKPKEPEQPKRRVDPMYHEKIDHLLDTYARKLAENMNQGFAIDARVPSVMIAGPANFPVGKKEKQNRARDSNMEEWRYIQGLLDKIHQHHNSRRTNPSYLPRYYQEQTSQYPWPEHP